MASKALSGRHTNTLASHTGPINCLAFSNLGGTYILTGSSDRSIHLSRTEPATSSSATSSSSSTSTSLTKLSKSSDDTPTSSPIQKYTSHGYAVLSISISSQNTHFASTGGDRAVFYWDIQTPSSTLRRFGSNTNQAHTSRITCVSFAAQDDGVLVSGSDDRTVRLWDVKSRDSRPLQILSEAKDSVTSLVVSGTDLIVGGVDGRIRTYDIRMGSVVTDVQPGPVTSLDLTRDGKMLLVSCLDGKLRVMDRLNGQLLRSMPVEGDGETKGGYRNHELRLQSCFGLDGAIACSGSEADGLVRAWDLVTGKRADTRLVSPGSKVVSVVKWRAGSKIQGRQDLWAAGGADGIVKIFNT